MQLTVALLAALCLAVPAFSEFAPCKPSVKGASNFNYTEFIPSQYRYVLGTETNITKTYSSAVETAAKVGEYYYSILTVYHADGSQVSTTYRIDKVINSTLYETVLNDGVPTNVIYTTTSYAYKSNLYNQFLVCGPTQTDKDLRFTVLFGGTKLTSKLKKELLNNDKNMGFNGKLITIGQRKELLSDLNDDAE